MDLDQNGTIDILSGSYSRQDRDMAGLLQMLPGTSDRGFAPASAVLGTDGEPLIIPADQQAMTDKICTRAFAADMDADGHLDLVVGNFTGTFAMFHGSGPGAFEPKPTMLKADGELLRIRGAHGDPCLVDWDDDGDLDLVSGSSDGGVQLSINAGTAAEPAFTKFTDLVPPAPPQWREVTDENGVTTMEPVFVLGEDHLKGSSGSSRVWVADVDGDGDQDLLVGDSIRLYHATEGVSPDEAKAAMDAFQASLSEHYASQPQPKMTADGTIDPDHMEAWEQEMEAWQAGYFALIEERDKTVREESTGFVWLYERK